MRLTKLFSLIQGRVTHVMRPLAIFCACLVGFCTTSSGLFGSTEYVIVVKVLQSDDKGIIERKNGERWLIENGAGALSFRRYEGKKVLIDSPGLFCGVGSKMILPDDDQEARVWSAELISEQSVRLQSDKSAFRGGAENGRKENDVQSVSFVPGTDTSGRTTEASGPAGSIETIPNRIIPGERITNSRPGLLGRRHASTQISVTRVMSRIDSIEASGTGVGGTAQLNIPLFSSESVGWGVDAFGILGGSGVSAHATDGVNKADLKGSGLGGSVGVNIFFDATDSVRPFTTLGVTILQESFTVFDGTDEFDLIESVALRSSILPDWDGLHRADFINELFLHPDEHWFLRLTLIAGIGDGQRDVTGQVGTGLRW
jgi:hypothetical protein